MLTLQGTSCRSKMLASQPPGFATNSPAPTQHTAQSRVKCHPPRSRGDARGNDGVVKLAGTAVIGLDKGEVAGLQVNLAQLTLQWVTVSAAFGGTLGPTAIGTVDWCCRRGVPDGRAVKGGTPT